MLFNLGEPPPEEMLRTTRWRLIGFALVIWIYRLTLFLGIAGLVYHFFIKIVGIGLFLVEMGWFVCLPFVMELREWHKRKEAIMSAKRVRGPLVLLVLAVLVVLLPWNGTVSAPAMLKAGESAGLYLPVGARLIEANAQAGQGVAEGDALFVFASPDLEGRRAELAARLKVLDYELQAVPHGGPIAVRGKESGLVPEAALSRVRLTVDGAPSAQQLRGTVRIHGQGQSLAAKAFRTAIAVLVREGGM